MNTTTTTTTIEYVEAEALEGPAILVHRTEGAYHAQGNPGELIAEFGPAEGVTADLTWAQVAEIAGIAADMVIVSEDAGVTCWEVQA